MTRSVVTKYQHSKRKSLKKEKQLAHRKARRYYRQMLKGGEWDILMKPALTSWDVD